MTCSCRKLSTGSVNACDALTNAAWAVGQVDGGLTWGRGCVPASVCPFSAAWRACWPRGARYTAQKALLKASIPPPQRKNEWDQLDLVGIYVIVHMLQPCMLNEDALNRVASWGHQRQAYDVGDSPEKTSCTGNQLFQQHFPNLKAREHLLFAPGHIFSWILAALYWIFESWDRDSLISCQSRCFSHHSSAKLAAKSTQMIFNGMKRCYFHHNIKKRTNVLFCICCKDRSVERN